VGLLYATDLAVVGRWGEVSAYTMALEKRLGAGGSPASGPAYQHGQDLYRRWSIGATATPRDVGIGQAEIERLTQPFDPLTTGRTDSPLPPEPTPIDSEEIPQAAVDAVEEEIGPFPISTSQPLEEYMFQIIADKRNDSDLSDEELRQELKDQGRLPWDLIDAWFDALSQSDREAAQAWVKADNNARQR